MQIFHQLWSDSISSYLDIVGLAEKQCSVHIDAALNELWRRLVFNVCVTNTDDHLRNHGFVLIDVNNWELSPAYDVNPNIDKIEHSLMLDFDSTENSLYNVFQVRELFRITEQQARDSIKYIQQTVSDNWQAFAAKYGVKNEIKLFTRCLSEADVVHFANI
jgi:serine/threonine-protein kinase HipA